MLFVLCFLFFNFTECLGNHPMSVHRALPHFYKKNKKDKPENNEAGCPQGWKRFGSEGQFSEYIFRCTVDFWNHITTVRIQEIKLNH